MLTPIVDRHPLTPILLHRPMSVTPDVILADAVTKRFAGREVVKDLTFLVRRGEIFALLGPNGAGKTTCVRMLTGIIRPDTGRIVVSLDGRVTAALPPAQGAYLPEERGLYREIPVLRTLVYFGRLRGLDRHDAERRATRWLERMGLADRAHERVDALSKGNQQRVQFIATVVHGPALAVLDEPFTGLNPISQEFFLDLVRELRDTGTTVVLSAHQMDLVERVADRVLLMNPGRDFLSGSVAELHARLDARPRIRLALLPGGDPDRLREDPDVDEVLAQAGGAEVTLRTGSDVSRFFARTLAALPVQGISSEPARLHDVFIRAVREDDADANRQAALGSGERMRGGRRMSPLRQALLVAGWEFRRYFKWRDQILGLVAFLVIAGLAYAGGRLANAGVGP
jgi:ABC-2 type transport system ATP-binding protein